MVHQKGVMAESVTDQRGDLDDLQEDSPTTTNLNDADDEHQRRFGLLSYSLSLYMFICPCLCLYIADSVDLLLKLNALT